MAVLQVGYKAARERSRTVFFDVVVEGNIDIIKHEKSNCSYSGMCTSSWSIHDA